LNESESLRPLRTTNVSQADASLFQVNGKHKSF
jgi:hypothetical protein